MKRVSAIVVNWNSGPCLGACLASLRRQMSVAEILVVDNGSSDGSLSAATGVDGIEVIEVGRNLGYASAANLGMGMATCPYLLICNPDVEFYAGSVDLLARIMGSLPTVGLVGPKLVSPDGTHQPSVRRYPKPYLWIFDGTVVADLWPGNPWRKWLLAEDWPADVSGPVDWLSGAVLMARRAAVDEVGGMDPGYFMYSEELDWCRRFREKGWLVWYEPGALAVHLGQVSSSQVPVETHIRYQVSRLRYLRKHFGPRWAQLFKVALYADYLSRLAIEAGKWVVGHRRGLRRGRMELYARVLGSRFSEGRNWEPVPGKRP